MNISVNHNQVEGIESGLEPSLNDPITSVNFERLDREEASTFYFAVLHYKHSLEADLKKIQDVVKNTPVGGTPLVETRVGQRPVPSDGLEDEEFLHGQLALCARLLYMIRWDAHTEQYIKWLDV